MISIQLGLVVPFSASTHRRVRAPLLGEGSAIFGHRGRTCGDRAHRRGRPGIALVRR